MKHAQSIGMKMAVGSALMLALGASTMAQVSGYGQVRRGRPLFEGSLENDIRPGILNLHVRLVEHGGIDPAALIPTVDDFGVSLTLSGGLAGSPAAIEVGLLTSSITDRDHGLANGAVISGFFGQGGEFVVELPPNIEVRGLGARGAQVSGRMETVVVDLEEEVEEAFVSWQALSGLAKPKGAGPGGKHELQRPSRGAGSASRGQINRGPESRTVILEEEPVREVNEVTFEELGSVAKPRMAGTAGGARELKRPGHKPGGSARGQINHKPATRSVDLSDDDAAGSSYSTEKLDDLDKPQQAGPGDKDALRRPSRRGGHIG
jgi:hypothetical protein